MLPVAVDAQFITAQPIDASMACLVDNSYFRVDQAKGWMIKFFQSSDVGTCLASHLEMCFA